MARSFPSSASPHYFNTHISKTRAHNQRFGYRDGYIYCLADPRLVLDIKGGSSKEGTKIILYKRKDGRDNGNQQWALIPAQNGQIQPSQPPPQYGSHQSGNVPYYPPPVGQQPYGGMQQQQGDGFHQHQQGTNNAPYHPPPAGGMGGYGPPDDENLQYGRRD